jgi:hypothetical protein
VSTNIRLLLWNLWAQDNTTVTASSEVADHEASRTKEMTLSTTWRMSGTSGFTDGALAQQRHIGAVGIVTGNLTNDATVRIRIGNDSSFGTTLFDTGTVQFYESIYTDTELTVGHLSEFFDGSGLPSVDTRRILKRDIHVLYLPNEIEAQYVRIDLDDPTNPDGYLEIPHVHVGRVFEPNPDIYYGWKIWRDDIARLPQSACGQFWSASVFRRTRLSCTATLQKETDVLGQWFLMQYLLGVGFGFIVSIERRKGSLRFYTTLYVKFAESSKNQYVSYHRFNIPMDMEEIVA